MPLYQRGPLYAELRSGLSSFRAGASLRIDSRLAWVSVSLGIIGLTLGYVVRRKDRPRHHARPPVQ